MRCSNTVRQSTRIQLYKTPLRQPSLLYHSIAQALLLLLLLQSPQQIPVNTFELPQESSERTTLDTRPSGSLSLRTEGPITSSNQSQYKSFRPYLPSAAARARSSAIFLNQHQSNTKNYKYPRYSHRAKIPPFSSRRK